MNNQFGLFILILMITSLSACNKIKYYPDKDYIETKTLILAHRAGGGETTTYQENTLEAAKYGLSALDGIETDIQINKDRTLWLSHTIDVQDCNGNSYGCFPEVTDQEIINIDSCNGQGLSYSWLEDVFAFMSANYPDKYISLDVKAWDPCAISSANVAGVMNVIGDEIIQLTQKYNLKNHVMVESETATFLDYIKYNSTGIACYLTSLGDFERAMQLTLQSGYAGISFKYKAKEEISAEHVQLIRRKGLKIQLWTVNDEESIKEALAIHPDFIQTDNIDFFKLLK